MEGGVARDVALVVGSGAALILLANSSGSAHTGGKSANPPSGGIMCLHPRPVDPVPEETARIAKAAFPKGNTLMRMRDELGAIFEDEDFADLFPRRGQPAMAPWRLAAPW